MQVRKFEFLKYTDDPPPKLTASHTSTPLVITTVVTVKLIKMT